MSERIIRWMHDNPWSLTALIVGTILFVGAWELPR